MLRIWLFEPDQKIAYLTQTTLSLDDVEEIVSSLKKRFPQYRNNAQLFHLLRHAKSPTGFTPNRRSSPIW